MSTRFFSQAAYAEDQHYGHIILSLHVLHRGLQSGALIGAIAGGARSYFLARRNRAESPLPPPAVSPKATTPGRISPSVLRSTGVGALAGTGLFTLALVGRMWGREGIEWQDRSWRLLANAGQVEVDDWSSIGGVLGAATAWATRGAADTSRVAGLRLLGGFGAGNLIGVVGYIATKVIRGDKWD